MQSIVQIVLRACSKCGRRPSLARSSFPLRIALCSAWLRFLRDRPIRTGHWKPNNQNYIRTKYLPKKDSQHHHVQIASIWSPVTLAEPTSPPSQDFQSAGPRLTGAGAGGTSCCCESSVRSVRETRGTWYPRRVLKSVSRRKNLAGDGNPTAAVDFIERTGLVAGLMDEGVGEVARALGAGEVLAGSRRGTSVKKSPVESTDGGLSSEPSGFN